MKHSTTNDVVAVITCSPLGQKSESHSIYVNKSEWVRLNWWRWLLDECTNVLGYLCSKERDQYCRVCMYFWAISHHFSRQGALSSRFTSRVMTSRKYGDSNLATRNCHYHGNKHSVPAHKFGSVLSLRIESYIVSIIYFYSKHLVRLNVTPL